MVRNDYYQSNFEIHNNQILKLYNQNYSIKDIANELNLNRITVRKRLILFGITPLENIKRRGYMIRKHYFGKKKEVKLNCDYCNKELIRKPSWANGRKNHFCNYQCHYKWMSVNSKGINGTFYGRKHKKEFLELDSKIHRKLYISKEELIDLYINRNLSSTTIAKSYNVSGNTVRNWLRRYNIKIKNVSKRIEGNNNPMYGKNHSDKTKQLISKITKDRWKNEEYLKKWINSVSIKPNKQELLLNQILQEKFPNEYKYVGDFKFWIDGKNPDFINVNGQKKIIEFFGTYFHKIKKEDDSQKRINHFKKYGYNTLIIWSPELQKQNRENLIKKIGEFHEK